MLFKGVLFSPSTHVSPEHHNNGFVSNREDEPVSPSVADAVLKWLSLKPTNSMLNALLTSIALH